MTTSHTEPEVAMNRSSCLEERAGSVPIERHPFYWLTLALNLRNTSLARVLAPLGCTASQWRVMNVLRQYPALSVGELAERTAVDRTTLTRTVEGLEKTGLLLRDVRADNRRIASLSLTEEGQHFFNKVLPLVQGLNEAATASIAGGEVEALVETLKKIVVNLGGSTNVSVPHGPEASARHERGNPPAVSAGTR